MGVVVCVGAATSRPSVATVCSSSAWPGIHTSRSLSARSMHLPHRSMRSFSRTMYRSLINVAPHAQHLIPAVSSYELHASHPSSHLRSVPLNGLSLSKHRPNSFRSESPVMSNQQLHVPHILPTGFITHPPWVPTRRCSTCLAACNNPRMRIDRGDKQSTRHRLHTNADRRRTAQSCLSSIRAHCPVEQGNGIGFILGRLAL